MRGVVLLQGNVQRARDRDARRARDRVPIGQLRVDGRQPLQLDREMRGRDDIAAMVHGPGHQRLITNGCGHVLTVPHIVVDGDEATGRSYALNIRWDAEADRFWVARVSANTWRWVRTPQGWRIADRVNAALDGTPEHREMLAPPAKTVA